MSKKQEVLEILFKLKDRCPVEDEVIQSQIAGMIEKTKKWGDFYAKAMLEKSIYQPNIDPKTNKPTWSCIDVLSSAVNESKEKYKLVKFNRGETNAN
jgi:hypothetical protein